MRRCHFCSRWFRSKQSVRAHLRWCEDYKDAQAVVMLPPETGPAAAPRRRDRER